MSIFSPKSSRSTLEAAQDELSKLRRRQEFSQRRHADASAAFAAAVSARTEILGGDDDNLQGLARADVCLAEAKRVLDGAADAAAVLAQKISEVEQKIAVEQEAIARAEAAAMFERFRTDIAAALGDYRSAGERLIAALAASTTEGVGLASGLRWHLERYMECDALVANFERRAAGIRGGALPLPVIAPPPRPEPAAPSAAEKGSTSEAA